MHDQPTAVPPTVSPQASVQTFRHALETAGSVDGLARNLHVPAARVRHWLSGDEVAPLELFLKALDLIAAGPFQAYLPERRKRRKVVVLDRHG